jgi:hypothetical protein
MSFDNIEINNNVKIDDLFNDKYWIHGNSKENINITIFLITINGHQLNYSLKSINNLDLDIPVLVNVIMNISPTNKAYNTMRIRCTTKYFIQLDEDMELFNNAINIFNNYIKLHKRKYFLYSFKLIDEYLGVGENNILEGIKFYNNDIMKKYTTFLNGESAVSSVDRLWHKPILNDGHSEISLSNILGYHARKRNGFDLLIRFSKNTNSILNNEIKKYSGDFCKLLRPLSKIENFDKVYFMILSHFFSYNNDEYNKNKNILYNLLKKQYIPKDSLNLYKIKHDYNIIPNNDYSFNFDNFIELFTYPLTFIQEMFCIIGIINKLFSNYEYSFDKYPYELYKYFNKVFNYRICVIIKDNSEIDIIKNIFLPYEFIELFFSFDDNITFEKYGVIDLIYKHIDMNNIIINSEKVEFNNEKEYINFILSQKRKNKIKIIDLENNIDNEKGYVYIIKTNENILFKNNIFYIDAKIIS